MSELLSERVITAANDVVLSRGGLKSNYERLFGTPERAARTIADSCRENEYECGGCPAVEAYCHNGDYDALLEWLRVEV